MERKRSRKECSTNSRARRRCDCGAEGEAGAGELWMHIVAARCADAHLEDAEDTSDAAEDADEDVSPKSTSEQAHSIPAHPFLIRHILFSFSILVAGDPTTGRWGWQDVEQSPGRDFGPAVHACPCRRRRRCCRAWPVTCDLDS